MKVTYQNLLELKKTLSYLSEERVFALELAMNIVKSDEVFELFKASQKALDKQFNEFDFVGDKPKNMKDTAKADKKDLFWIYKIVPNPNGKGLILEPFQDETKKYVIATDETKKKYSDKHTYASFFVNPERFTEYNKACHNLLNIKEEEFHPVLIDLDDVNAVAREKGLNGSHLSVLMKYGIIEK